MSILSKALSGLWRTIKGGRTDLQTAFGLYVLGLKPEQRNQLWRELSAVQFAVDMASQNSQDPRVQTAKQWVDGALEVLG